MKCKNCMAEIEDGTLFCPECGARVDSDSDKTVVLQEDVEAARIAEEKQAAMGKEKEEPKRQQDVKAQTSKKMKKKEDKKPEPKQTEEKAPEAQAGAEEELCFCPNCGNKIESSSVFCEFCGYRMDGAPEEGPAPEEIPAATPKKSIKIPPAVIGGAAAAVIVIGAGAFLVPKVFSGGGSKGNIPAEVFYIKDGGQYGISPKNKKQKFTEYTDDLTDDSYALAGESRGLPMLTKDGKYRIIIEDLSYDDTMTLYYQKGKGDPMKIDSGVLSRYSLTDDDKVVYCKNGNLYVFDLKAKKPDKEKVASDVYSFLISEDSKTVLWFENSGSENRIYYRDLALKKDKEKLDSGSTMVQCSDDFNTILLQKDDNLYLSQKLGKPEKLVSDIESVYGVDLTKGTFYYTKSVENKAKAMDYVTDDMAATDGQMTEPRKEDYQETYTTQGYFSSYTGTRTKDEYYDKVEEYNQKQRRDRLREELRNTEITITSEELYYYAGGESTLLASDFVEMVNYGGLSDKNKNQSSDYTGWILYKKAEPEAVASVNLSELSGAYEVESMVYDAQGSDTTYAVSCAGKEAVLDLDDQVITSVRNDSKNNQLYLLIREYEADSSDGYELKTMALSSKNLGKLEDKDDEVDRIGAVAGGSVYYFKDVNDYNLGDLYYNGEMVKSDVNSNSVEAVHDSNAILCLYDTSSSDYSGTLLQVKGDKVQEISDDCSGYYYAFEENAVILLSDYNNNRMRGDLEYYNGKDTYLLDSDVTGFFIP